MQKNGYTFATVYNSKCVSVFLHQTILYPPAPLFSTALHTAYAPSFSLANYWPMYVPLYSGVHYIYKLPCPLLSFRNSKYETKDSKAIHDIKSSNILSEMFRYHTENQQSRK